MRLYLPEAWASDIGRRRRVGVPDDVVFKRKWELAIDLLDEALSWGVTPRLALADSGYGDSTEFRDALTARGCRYLVGLAGDRLAWPPGSNPRPPRTNPRKPGPRRTVYRDGNRKPKPIAEIAKSLDYRSYSCPDGKGGVKAGLFAFTRVHLAERRTKGRPPSEEMWLVAEYRPGNNEYKFYGRTWRGFHHHATLCAAAHGFLALQRRLFPPADLSLDLADGAPPNSAASAATHRDVPALSPGV
jgi:hypothetical protein